MDYFTFGMKKLRVTQNYNGSISHRLHWYNSKDYADYPIDIHSYSKDGSTLESTRVDYELPIECLKASGYDNLYIAGRIVSADFQAQAALRIQSSCFSMGEAVAKDVLKRINAKQ